MTCNMCKGINTIYFRVSFLLVGCEKNLNLKKPPLIVIFEEQKKWLIYMRQLRLTVDESWTMGV